MMNSPFDLDNNHAYQQWKQHKLKNAPATLSDITCHIQDATALTREELDQILHVVEQTNMVIISAPNEVTSEVVTALGKQIGLQQIDANIYSSENAVTALAVQNRPSRQQAFIPYTDKPIAWHTDGYYNPLDQQIRGMVLYCAEPAAIGGENKLIDPEMAYIHIRDRDPQFIEILSHPEVMTIPAHEVDGHTLRPTQTGPVFSVINNHLHMRYTHRKKSIIWLDHPLVAPALACLHELFEDDAPYQLKGKLAKGQALLCNNVLHNRTRFEDSATQTRLMYRGRYFDRISSQAPPS